MNQYKKEVTAVITEKADKSVKAGHPWIYHTEIVSVNGTFENGDLIQVKNQKGKFVGTGFINEHSKIRIRLISTNANDKMDEAFFERRLKHAIDYRKTVMGNDFDCCRLIFGEADFFPGFTVDKFHNLLVTQTLCLGIERLKPLLFSLLYKIMKEYGENICAIYERNDVAIRELEGMEQNKGFFLLEGQKAPSLPETIEIEENKIKYCVDYKNGQKTGFFLDQKYNRSAIAKIAKGKTMLDCFTHTGAFGLNAAYAGAKHVHAVDISQDVIDIAFENAKRNHLENKMSFQCENVFDLLSELAEKKSKEYDFILLDPPAFTKSNATLKNAVRGYKEINLKAMKILPRGGYLATCSCSHFMTEELFQKMLKDAAKDANVSLRQIEARQQSPDHPIVWNIPETNYLKFYIFQIV